MDSKKLTSVDYVAAAALLQTGVAEIKAVRDVESGGIGFLSDGRIIIRFEGHKFREFTGGKFDASHPTISHHYMPNCPYNKGVRSDYDRLKIAMSLDATAALKACSWGMFQIMGEECWRCGFKSVHDFVDYLKLGEAQQLTAFCRFLVNKKLDGYLRAHQWDKLAFGYNGANYRAGNYHTKLATRYAFHLTNP